HTLMDLFAATPFRPTGLATADQGLANVVELLEWCTSLVADALDGRMDLGEVAPTDRELLGAAAALLEDVSWLLGREDIRDSDVERDLNRLRRGAGPPAPPPPGAARGPARRPRGPPHAAEPAARP